MERGTVAMLSFVQAMMRSVSLAGSTPKVTTERAEAELAVELLRPAAVVGDDEDQVGCRRERLLQRVGEDRPRVATPPRFGGGEHILHLRDSAVAC